MTMPTNAIITADAKVHRLKPKTRAKAASGYRMVNKGNARGEIYLYGVIGMDWFSEGVTANQFRKDLKGLGSVTAIDLRINSDGGVINDARAMYNLLVEHPAKVTTHIDGIAASAASFVAMAGDEIEIAEGGFVMIHNARGAARGQAEDFRRLADVLDQMNEVIRDTYVARTGNKAEQVKAWMDAETWFNGKDAVKNGFAGKVVENMKMTASLRDPSEFTNLPAALRPNRAAAAEILAAIRG